jgi:hypothetical protein
MKTVLMGLAGLGMLVFGAGANASPLATGTNLATPDIGASNIGQRQLSLRSAASSHPDWVLPQIWCRGVFSRVSVIRSG